MDKGILAKAATTIDAPAGKVWEALTTPQTIKKFMFGADTTTTWKVGDKINWKGEWQGKPFDDHGEILKIEPEKSLIYTHFSPLSGKPDKPENYHTVKYDLSENDGRTEVVLTQDGNPDWKQADEMGKMWQMMLDRLKETVEGEGARRAAG